MSLTESLPLEKLCSSIPKVLLRKTGFYFASRISANNNSNNKTFLVKPVPFALGFSPLVTTSFLQSFGIDLM